MTQNDKPVNIAIAGLGTVGAGTVNLIEQQSTLLATRTGRQLKVVAVSARNKSQDRGCNLDEIQWYDNAVDMAKDANADIFIELIGGSEGIAKDAVEAALDAGKHVVTANKALMAHHGHALALRAEEKGLALAYEAAVAGGIPVIKSIREGLAGNRFSDLHGILNGTCNYILTTMRETGRDFADVLAEAQELGYAEADPTFDVDGIDAAHKLALLASLAFGTKVNYDGMHIEGIRHISATDIEYASELGYKIKLLGIAENGEDGIFQRVHPVMVPADKPIAGVEGVFNAVVTEGDFVGTTVLEGRGAGAGPTASAVVADVVDIACGRIGPAFGAPAAKLEEKPTMTMDHHSGAYYVRLQVIDRPGVMAEITGILREENISMEGILQRGRAPGAEVSVVMTIHETSEKSLVAALAKMEALDSIVKKPCMIRVEKFAEN